VVTGQSPLVLSNICFGKKKQTTKPMPLDSSRNETSYRSKKPDNVKGENTFDKFSPKSKFQNRKLKKFHFQTANFIVVPLKISFLISFCLKALSKLSLNFKMGFCHPKIAFFSDQVIHPKNSSPKRLMAVPHPASAPGSPGAGWPWGLAAIGALAPGRCCDSGESCSKALVC